MRPADGSGCQVAAWARMPSRSSVRSARSASRSSRSANPSCSPACTSPRWRSGNAIALSRGTLPSNGRPRARHRAGNAFAVAIAADPVQHHAGDADGRIVQHEPIAPPPRPSAIGRRRPAPATPAADTAPPGRPRHRYALAPPRHRRTGPSPTRSAPHRRPSPRRRRCNPTAPAPSPSYPGSDTARRTPRHGMPDRCNPARTWQRAPSARAGAAPQGSPASAWSCRSPSAARR